MPAQILVVYAGHSPTGSTATLAGWISAGAAARGATSVVKSATTATRADVEAADALVLGSGVYNGDVEPAMSTFLDATIQPPGAAKVDLSTKIGAAFCTSASYVTGAQPTLNTMARQLMTFGAVFVGTGSWHASQGVCGQVTDSTPTHPLPGGQTWEFTAGQTYLEEDAKAFGGRIADIAGFYPAAYAAAAGLPPSSGRAITCRGAVTRDSMLLWMWIVGFVILLAAILAVGLTRRR
jgi:multimeric flavodoxin WrbA